MTVQAQTLSEFNGKNVILHLIQDDNSVKEVEGKIEAASAAGVAFREKGKRDVDLVEPHQIEEIAPAPEKPKRVIQKKLKPIADGNVRQHLVDRHGFSLPQAQELSEADAVELHNNIDHSELGHKHVEPTEDDESDEAGEPEAA